MTKSSKTKRYSSLYRNEEVKSRFATRYLNLRKQNCLSNLKVLKAKQVVKAFDDHKSDVDLFCDILARSKVAYEFFIFRGYQLKCLEYVTKSYADKTIRDMDREQILKKHEQLENGDELSPYALCLINEGNTSPQNLDKEFNNIHCSLCLDNFSENEEMIRHPGKCSCIMHTRCLHAIISDSKSPTFLFICTRCKEPQNSYQIMIYNSKKMKEINENFQETMFEAEIQ